MTDLGSTPHILAAAPTLADFNQLIWWLVLLKVAVVFAFLLLMTMFMIWAERRVIGRMQNRPGPNRAGPLGLLQPIADAIKPPLKEDIIPTNADKLIFVIAPVVSAIPAFVSFAIIPFGPVVSIFHHQTPLQLADLPVAVLLVLAMSSIGVYGIVLSGWASGSPYSLLGALRSVAQVISYESPWAWPSSPCSCTRVAVHHRDRLGPAAPVVRGAAGRLLPDLPGRDGRRDQPAAVRPARGRRRAGRRVPHEYSSMKFAMFYLAEYINMTTVAGPATTLFLGGWRAPWPLSLWSGANSGWLPVLWFLAKVLDLYVLLHLAARHAAGVRYDQLMAIGWKVLIPVSIVWLLMVATVRAWRLDTHNKIPYFVGALILIILLVLAWAWDNAAQERQARRAGGTGSARPHRTRRPAPP